MAVHAVCEFCGRKFSVPDNLKGKKIACPGCKKKTRVVTALELSVQEGRYKHETSLVPEQAQEPKQAQDSKEAQSRVQAEPAQPPQPPSPAPDTATDYAALRAFKAVFTFFACLFGIAGVAVGIVLFLNSADQRQGLLLLLGFFVGAVVTFCVFKLLAEAARLGADLGDMESRMLGLLFEIRDKLDNLKK